MKAGRTNAPSFQKIGPTDVSRPGSIGRSARFCFAVIVLAVMLDSLSVVSAQGVEQPDDAMGDLPRLVETLGHDSFQSRRIAANTLLRLVKPGQSDSTTGKAVIRAMKDGLLHRDLEVRAASMRLLQSIEQADFDFQLQQLLNPRTDADSIDLAGWKRFSAMAGDDAAARALFAQVATRFSSTLREMESDQASALNQSAILSQTDPYRIDSADAAAWAMVLCWDDPRLGLNVNLSPRLAKSLCHSGLGPKLRRRNDAIVIRRMIAHWLGNHAAASVRDRLLIAMRYECARRAEELCDQTLADPGGRPSGQVMAMLCASALQHADIQQSLIDRLGDDRTSHVWQLIASRQTKIRTQVSDVALALLLHRHQIDPRSVGFDELQADPKLVFREHSLGFANSELRQAAYRRAAKVLANNGVDIGEE